MNREEKSQRRAAAVLAAYGENQSAWPPDERADVSEALSQSAVLQQIRSNEAVVDRLLSQSSTVASLDAEQVARTIAQRIPQRLSIVAKVKGVLEVLGEWCMAGSWRPALVGSTTVSLGLILGATLYVPTEDWSQAEQYSFSVVGDGASDAVAEEF